MPIRFVRRCLLGLLVWLVFGIGHAAEPIIVFAAASLKESLDEAAAAYQQATGQEVVVSVGGSATLARQIEQGAPAHLFVSADREWMDWLQEREMIDPDSRVDLLRNELVVIAPVGRVARTITWDALPAWVRQLPESERVALAETDTVPAGRYAKAALQALNLWSALASRRVETENVRAALLLVARDEAAFGIVYRTDAMVEPRVSVLTAVPSNQHPEIVYPLAAVRANWHPAKADFARWLQSPTAQAMFRRHGFLLP
ncbi:molybdate ABC transporter substrate-binding protein [Ahniella affigens]|uniref:molybdate ABC transporter substrate-binding protein n=1 Tax=Ahniella affigens TaxID=2021234 RepID=UPI001F0BD45A|nr:molybdate ABC transporter substrate-binding protein [Ahniella affigens]